jgi:SAM-dependent methyltransferase
MAMTPKQVAYGILDAFGLELDGFPNEGVAAFGYWLRPSRGKGQAGFRGANALERCLRLEPASVLDVGSGGGEQARTFVAAGCEVTCVDFGSSTYARNAMPVSGCKLIQGDFSILSFDRQYDLIWCSHTLEHQPNANAFITKLNTLCTPGGWVCLTLPVCHRALWGGHLSLWTPGLLAYNIAFAGFDVSGAELIHGRREFSLLYQPKAVALPALTFDSGDIDLMRPFLPKWCREGKDSW